MTDTESFTRVSPPNDFLPMIVIIIFANLLLTCSYVTWLLQMVCALHGLNIYGHTVFTSVLLIMQQRRFPVQLHAVSSHDVMLHGWHVSWHLPTYLNYFYWHFITVVANFSCYINVCLITETVQKHNKHAVIYNNSISLIVWCFKLHSCVFWIVDVVIVSLLPVARMNQAPTCSPLFIIPVSYLLMFVFLYLLPHWIQRMSPRCCQDYGYPSQLVPNAKCGPMKCAKARDVHEVTAKGVAFSWVSSLQCTLTWRCRLFGSTSVQKCSRREVDWLTGTRPAWRRKICR